MEEKHQARSGAQEDQTRRMLDQTRSGAHELAEEAPPRPSAARAGAERAGTAGLLPTAQARGALASTAARPEEARQWPLWAYGLLLAMVAFLLLYSLLINGYISPCAFVDDRLRI